MKRAIGLMVAGMALSIGVLSQPVLAANSQQDKMTSCNADAKTKNLSGDQRKAFMKTCLSSGSASQASANSQQEKMKTCNADAKAKSLSGDDRKKFMSDCLKSAH